MPLEQQKTRTGIDLVEAIVAQIVVKNDLEKNYQQLLGLTQSNDLATRVAAARYLIQYACLLQNCNTCLIASNASTQRNWINILNEAVIGSADVLVHAIKGMAYARQQLEKIKRTIMTYLLSTNHAEVAQIAASLCDYQTISQIKLELDAEGKIIIRDAIRKASTRLTECELITAQALFWLTKAFSIPLTETESIDFLSQISETITSEREKLGNDCRTKIAVLKAVIENVAMNHPSEYVSNRAICYLLKDLTHSKSHLVHNYNIQKLSVVLRYQLEQHDLNIELSFTSHDALFKVVSGFIIPSEIRSMLRSEVEYK